MSMPSLFQIGNFHLHSGEPSRWKIDCDHLTDGDIEALALMASELIPAPFGLVVSIPRGGTRLGNAMQSYVAPGASPTLIVDDVLTTGASIECVKDAQNSAGIGVFGLVIFARGPCPSWITPIFKMPRARQPGVTRVAPTSK